MNSTIEKEKKLNLALTKLKNLNLKSPDIKNNIDDLSLQKFTKLDHFLNQNIFKIEKKFQNFVEKVTIILDLDVFFFCRNICKKK